MANGNMVLQAYGGIATCVVIIHCGVAQATTHDGVVAHVVATHISVARVVTRDGAMLFYNDGGRCYKIYFLFFNSATSRIFNHLLLCPYTQERGEKKNEKKEKRERFETCSRIPTLLVGKNVIAQASSGNNNTSNTNTNNKNSKTQRQNKFVAFNIK